MTQCQKKKKVAITKKLGAYIESLNERNAFIGGAPVKRSGKILEKRADNQKDWRIEPDQSIGGY